MPSDSPGPARRLLALSACGLLAALAVASGIATGCSGGSTNGADPCQLNSEGCECAAEGQTIECAETVSQGGDDMTCRAGTRLCSGGKWGACVGSNMSIRSKPAYRAKALGPCVDNPCAVDCKQFDDDPTDIDGGTRADGGGITLPEGGAGSGTGPCTNLECKIDKCGTGPDDWKKTELKGRVYDPAGKNPIPNIVVYIPNATPGAFTDGVSCDDCSKGWGSPIISTITDYKGEFTLRGVPSGNNIPLVIRSGKWRRQLTVATVTKCVTNDISSTNAADGLPMVRFPKNRGEGDIPRIAFVSGSADPFQCVLSKMGMDVSTTSSEIGVPVVSGAINPDRIHYYQGTSSAGQNLSSTLGGGAPSADSLYGDTARLNLYDAIILACEGGEYDKGSTINQRIVDWVAKGGRVFATHYSYAYLEKAPAATKWPQVVKAWNHTSNPTDPMATVINRTFPKGNIFSNWLEYVGASTTPGVLWISEGRHDYDYVDISRSTPWMIANQDGSVPALKNGGDFCANNDQCASGSCSPATTLPAPVNGGFESGLSGWTTYGASVSASGTPRTGSGALRLGSTKDDWNYVVQTFTSPATASLLSVSYTWNLPGPNDFAGILICDNSTGSCWWPILTTSNVDSWTTLNEPINPSRSYTIYLALYDYNDGNAPVARFDDVVVMGGGKCAAGVKACTVDADCPGGTGKACWNGTCVPPHTYEPMMTFNVPVDSPATSQCGRVVFSDFHVSASALNGSSSTFPGGCKTGDLSAQEKALEFMLFDLTSCLLPDWKPPSPPPYTPTTVIRDYDASCPVGTQVVWRFFDWKSITPSDSSIVFSVQTGNTQAELDAMTPVALAKVTGPPITTWTGRDVDTVLRAATPPSKSKRKLRVNITLNPSSAGTEAPTLVDWRQSYSCVPEE